MRLDWSTIFQIKAVQDGLLQPLLQPFEDIFKEELGTYTGDKAKIHIDLSVAPKFCKYRRLPYAMREMVEKELQRLETLGIIKPVKSSKWAALIVPVLKPDQKSIRICGDYKLTANKASRFRPVHRGGSRGFERTPLFCSLKLILPVTLNINLIHCASCYSYMHSCHHLLNSQ